MTFEEDAVYDQFDAEGFIKLNALRLKLLGRQKWLNLRSSKPFWRQKAVSVLRNRQQWSLGRPAGHRRDMGGDLRFRISNVTNQTGFAFALFGCVNAVNADINDTSAGLDPIGLDHFRNADRGDQNIGLAADGR